MNSDTLGVYVHIPFCKSKCPYCDFYSVPPYQMEEYINKLSLEIKKWGKDLCGTVDTIYFGGGTPSALMPGHIIKIIDSIHESFKVSKPEITLEVNPADYKLMDFKKLKFNGVNRISIGAQSLNDSELKTLGRRHTTRDVVAAYSRIKNAGIENMSVDAILGIPGQSQQSIDEFINFCTENKVSHVSAYLLKIEPGTPYYHNKKFLNLPDDDECSDIYMHVAQTLSCRGYNHYEISNFALSGFESRHNLKYWNLDQYIGIGPSAHSFIGGKRFYYKDTVESFLSCPHLAEEGSRDAEKEYIMLRLRLVSGLNSNEYKRKFGEDIPKVYFEKIKKYINLGFAKSDDEGIRLTLPGFLISNTIIGDILYGDN